MPKYSKEAQDTRKQPTARTSLDINAPAYEVTARPGDHFEQQGMDSGLLNSIQSLKALSGAVGSYSTMQESQRKDNQLEVQKNFEQGKSKEESIPERNFLNLQVGAEDTWDLLSAKKHTAEVFTPAITKYTEENKHLPEGEFNAGLNKLSTEFMGGFQSAHQVAGAVPEANALVAAARNANLTTNIKNKQIERDGLLFANLRTDQETSIKEFLGMSLTDDLKTTMADPVFREYLQSPEGAIQKGLLAKNLYDKYRMGVGDAKALGKTTSQYSSEFLHSMSQMAETYGMPELLEYTKHSFMPTAEQMDKGMVPDKRTVADTYPEIVQKSIMQATVMENHINSAIEKAKREAQEKAKNLYVGDMDHKLFTILNGDSPTRYVEAEQAMNDFHKNASEYDLKPEERKYIDAQYLAVRNRGSFASHNDDAVVNGLYAKWNDLKVSDITTKHNLMTEKTYGEMLRHASDLEQSRLNRSVDKSHHYEYMAFDMVLKGLREPYMKYDKMTNTLTPESIQDLSKFDQMVGLEIRRGLKDPKVLQEWYQKSVQTVLPIRDRLMGSPGDNKPPKTDTKVYDKGALPPAAANKGAVMIDPKTKHTITSNGSIWVDTKTGKEVK